MVLYVQFYLFKGCEQLVILLATFFVRLLVYRQLGSTIAFVRYPFPIRSIFIFIVFLSHISFRSFQFRFRFQCETRKQNNKDCLSGLVPFSTLPPWPVYGVVPVAAMLSR